MNKPLQQDMTRAQKRYTKPETKHTCMEANSNPDLIIIIKFKSILHIDLILNI